MRWRYKPFVFGLLLLLCGTANAQRQRDTSEGPLWIAMSPHPGETVDGTQGLYIVAKFNRKFSIKGLSLLVFIDDQLVSGNVRIVDNTLYALYTQPLKAGEHTIRIDIRRWIITYEWKFFSTESPRQGPDSLNPAREKWKLQGNVYAESRLENITGPGKALRQEPPHTNQVNMNLMATYKDLKLFSRIFATSDEVQYPTNFQSKNYFQVGADWRNFGLTLGDMNPVFDRLTLTGARIQGGMLTLRHKKTQLTVVKGIMSRDVEGQVKRLEPYEYPPPNLRPDSTYVMPGNYLRRTVAARLQFGSLTEGSLLGINFFKARDDVNSIMYGVAPKDNVVFSIDDQMQNFNGKAKLAWGWAISGLTNDISNGFITKTELDSVLKNPDQPFDPGKWKGLLIINESTLVPSKRSKSSYVTVTKSLFRTHQIFLEYRKTGSAFVSYGNPFQRNNQLSLEGQERFNFFKRRITGNVRYQYLQNNVSYTDFSTLTTNIYGGYIHFNINRKLPQLSASVLNQLREAKASESILFTQHDELRSLNVILSYNFKAGSQHLINLNYTQSERIDKVNTMNNNNTRIYTASLTERFQIPLELNGFYSIVHFIDYKNNVNPLNSSYNASIKYTLSKQKLSLSLSYLNNTVFANPFTPRANRPMYRMIVSWAQVKNMRFDLELGSSPYSDALNSNNNYNETYAYVRYTYNFGM